MGLFSFLKPKECILSVVWAFLVHITDMLQSKLSMFWGECLFHHKNYAWGRYQKKAPKGQKKNFVQLCYDQKTLKGQMVPKEQKTQIKPDITPNITQNKACGWGWGLRRAKY